MPNERTTLKNQIDAYLRELRPHVWFRKKWGGGVFQHEGDWDYFVIYYGLGGVIEAKHPITRPKLAPAQIVFGNTIVRAGGFAIEAFSVNDVRLGLAKAHAIRVFPRGGAGIV